MTLTDTRPDRVLASTCEPRTDGEWTHRVPGYPDYTVLADQDNPWRWVVYYNPIIGPVFPEGADLRTRFAAQRVARGRTKIIKSVAGVIEQGTDLLSWYAHRPHRQSKSGMKHFHTYPFADAAVAEICRRDHNARKKAA